MPGVVERLPALVDLNAVFSPLYSAGTPGFAVIFGLGIGFSYLPRFLRSRRSIRSLIVRNAAVLGVGIVALAAVRIAGTLAAGVAMSPVDVSDAFYGVLTYYLLAVLSIPLWLKWLTARRSLWASCLALAGVMYGLHLAVMAWHPAPSENPIVQTGILLITAKFNYFEMTTGVLVGVAAGHWLRTLIVEDKPLGATAWSGLLLMMLGVLVSVEMGFGRSWFQWPKPMHVYTWIFYAGAVMCAVPLVYALAIRANAHRLVSRSLNVLSVIGILAFPIFIGHELVIPLKDLLVAWGIPAALPISMALFIAAIGYLIMRVYRIYYATSAKDAPLAS